MKTETLKEQAQRIKEETAHKEEYPRCEKCGGIMLRKFIGDEGYNHCQNCDWFTH